MELSLYARMLEYHPLRYTKEGTIRAWINLLEKCKAFAKECISQTISPDVATFWQNCYALLTRDNIIQGFIDDFLVEVGRIKVYLPVYTFDPKDITKAISSV